MISNSFQTILKSSRFLGFKALNVNGTSRLLSTTDGIQTLSTKYGGKHRVVLIDGDGVGPEMMFHVKEALKHVRAPIDFEEINLNSKTATDSLINQTILALRRNGVGLNGVIDTDYDNPNSFSINVLLLQKLDMFANVLRCKTVNNVKTRHQDIDIIIIRENTEGEYSNLEYESVQGVVESLKIITKDKSMRIAEFAFAQAHKEGRKKITAVHKANIMKLGDGLFLSCCKEVSKKYLNIQFETMIVDNTCMQLVSKPQQFDVMVMPNLYGNIVSNVATGLVGGAGLVAGSNFGTNCALFEPGTRSSGKGIAGQNTANPSGMLFAAANMLKFIGLEQHCFVIKSAVVNTAVKHNIKTADIGGTASTTEFMRKVLEEIQIQTPEIGFKNINHNVAQHI